MKCHCVDREPSQGHAVSCPSSSAALDRIADALFGALVIAVIFVGVLYFTTRPDPTAELLEKYADGEVPSDAELAELLERYAPEGDQRD